VIDSPKPHPAAPADRKEDAIREAEVSDLGLELNARSHPVLGDCPADQRAGLAADLRRPDHPTWGAAVQDAGAGPSPDAEGPAKLHSAPVRAPGAPTNFSISIAPPVSSRWF
jgi:hypothetical protein